MTEMTEKTEKRKKRSESSEAHPQGTEATVAEAAVAESDEFSDLYGTDPDLEGFEDASTPSVDGWWNNEVGLSFYGQLVGTFRIPGDEEMKDRDVVLVRLRAPCKAQKEKDGGPIRLEPGQVLGVSLSYGLRSLLEYVEHKGIVFAKATGQKKVGRRPKPMWVYELKVKGRKTAPVAPAVRGSEEDNIPF